jgi:Inositolphosphorylceramide synthase subunit Kei1
MKLVAYAYYFLIDYLVNIFYTILFASIWFLIFSDTEKAPSLGGEVLDNVKLAAGLVDPILTNVTKNIATPYPSQPATLVGETASVGQDSGGGSTYSSMSIFLFLLIKLYFVVIVFSYARSLVVRSHISIVTVSLSPGLWGKAQRLMLSSTYWKEEDNDYKQVA